MTRDEVRRSTPAQIEAWLTAADWVQYDFMGWRLDVKRRVIHCNLTGAIDMQLRRDANKKPKPLTPGPGLR